MSKSYYNILQIIYLYRSINTDRILMVRNNTIKKRIKNNLLIIRRNYGIVRKYYKLSKYNRTNVIIIPYSNNNLSTTWKKIA